ncbi:uncharacterized protein [Rhodnius prolixus]|uniref:uncharacterized protein n=1 Tax=Rhodnius prolixus TaxID=13249 RepID=UPI003D18BE98
MGMKITDNLYISNLLFAEDQVIIAEDEDDACYMLRKLMESYAEWGLGIHFDKSQHLSTSNASTLEIEGRRIKRVDHFKYLGSMVEKDGSSKQKVERRIREAKKVIGLLNPGL